MLSFQPLSSGTSFLRSLPYISLRKHRGEVHNAILIPKLKRRFQYSSAVPRSIAGCSYKEYRGSAHRARGLIQAKAQSPIPPLSGGEDARETEGKGRGLSEQSEFRSPRRRDRSDKPISSTTAAALLGSFFSLLRRMNK